MPAAIDAKKAKSARQRSVLVVDDEPLNMKLFALVLQKRGYHVLQASDGFHAFVLAHDQKPDVIVMDVRMPRLSGLEVTRTLKDSAYTKEIPVIIATAFLIDAATLQESGCDGYIAKPFAATDLVALIESTIENRELKAVA